MRGYWSDIISCEVRRVMALMSLVIVNDRLFMQITANEPQFTGHFPDRPIMPGVLMVEAMAQLGGTIALQQPISDGEGLFFFAGEDEANIVLVAIPTSEHSPIQAFSRPLSPVDGPS